MVFLRCLRCPSGNCSLYLCGVHREPRLFTRQELIIRKHKSADSRPRGGVRRKGKHSSFNSLQVHKEHSEYLLRSVIAGGGRLRAVLLVVQSHKDATVGPLLDGIRRRLDDLLHALLGESATRREPRGKARDWEKRKIKREREKERASAKRVGARHFTEVEQRRRHRRHGTLSVRLSLLRKPHSFRVFTHGCLFQELFLKRGRGEGLGACCRFHPAQCQPWGASACHMILP